MTVKRAETMEEFLARGGKVNIIPPAEREEPTHTLQVKTAIDHSTMSLGDAEFMFGEVRARKAKEPKKQVTSDEFEKMVESSGLPQSVMDALKNSMRK